MSRGFSNVTAILVGIVILVAVAGGSFLLGQKSGASIMISKSTSNGNQFALGKNSDLCALEKDKIINLINTFESYQIKREDGDVQRILALFTPPNNPGDSSVYIHLSGSDASGQRLYSSGQTDFKQLSFKILKEPTNDAFGGCVTKVEEQRSYYPHGVGGDFGPIQSRIFYFVTVKQDGIWKVDRYLSDGGSVYKYSGWGYY